MQQASVILGRGNGDPVLTICMPGGDDGLLQVARGRRLGRAGVKERRSWDGRGGGIDDGGGVTRGKDSRIRSCGENGEYCEGDDSGQRDSSLPFQPTTISISQPLLGHSPTPKTCCRPRAFQPQVTHQSAACSVGRAPSHV